MTDETTSRVNQEWPAGLKEAVQTKVGRRGLTEFTVLAVQRQLDDGGADLAVEARDARDLAQRLANVLATVVDHEARLTFLSSVILPDWIDTRSWPDEALSRLNEVQTSVEAEPEPEPEIDPVPEMKKVGSVTTTRVEPKAGDVGTAEDPVVYPEGRINAMDGPKYAALQHVHSPDGRCLKNLFIERSPDGEKHCPLVDETPAPTVTIPQGGDNLFERLKQSGALKSASELPAPEPREEPAAVPQPVVVAPAPIEPSIEQTAGPDSGPLPPIPEEAYAPDAVALPQDDGTCPNCKTELDDGLCWGCGYAA